MHVTRHLGKRWDSPTPRTFKSYLNLQTQFRWYESLGDWTNLRCTVCKHQYDGPTAVALGEIGLARVEGAEQVDETLIAKMLDILGRLVRSKPMT